MGLDTSPLCLELLLLVFQKHLTTNNILSSITRREEEVSTNVELTTKKSLRLISLLDAVAAISIYKPKNQVIAVSLSVDVTGCVLHIAGNDGVPPPVVEHLYAVFNMLQTIRSSLHTPLEAGTDTEDTPQPNKGEDTPNLERSLTLMVFEFSFQKFIKRLNAKYPQFKKEVVVFMKEYEKDQGDQWTNAQRQDYRKFEEAASTLDTISEWSATLPESPDQRSFALAQGLTAVTNTINASASDFRSMLKDEEATSTIAVWEREIMKRSGKTIFRLRRYLSKVFSLSYHIESLLKNVAYSYRMANILESKNALKIHVLEKEEKQITFPVSDAIIRQALTRLEIANNIMDEVTPAVWQSIQENKSCFDGERYTFTSRVHCEALLLKYHSSNPNFPPLSYIGVSKLSCYPCHTLFHAYNTSGLVDQRFFTKGSHAKIYPHWSIPSGFGGDKDKVVRSRLMEYFEGDLKGLLKTQDKTRSGSDSTDVSAASEDVITPSGSEDVKSGRAFLRSIIQATKATR